MGITSMLNQKGAVAAAQPVVQQQPQALTPEQSVAQQLPPVPLDRADSPHGSEHSRYSQPPMNGGLQNGRPYGSPTVMHAPLHMPEPNMAPSGMAFPTMAADMSHAMAQFAKPPEAAPQPPPKAYPCSTCGKGFARRSDLARHGKLLSQSPCRQQLCPNKIPRENTYRSSTTCLRLPRLWKAVHPEVCLNCSSACSHGREAAHVRALWKGKKDLCPWRTQIDLESC